MILGSSEVKRLGLVHPLRPGRLQPAGYHLGVEDIVCTYRVASAPTVRLGDELDCETVKKLVECRRVGRIRLYPGRWYLLLSEEELRLPPDVAAFVQLRSTPARLGVVMPPTFVDPGFHGRLVLEVTTVVPVEFEPGYELAHITFMRVEGDTMGGYRGVYQNQVGVKIRNCLLEPVEGRSPGTEGGEARRGDCGEISRQGVAGLGAGFCAESPRW